MRDEEPTKSECLDESGERWRRAVGQRCSAGEADFDRGRERAIAARGGAGIRAAYEERDGREDIRLSELVASDLLRERGLSERE